jgi:hypothetical protein
MKHRISIFLLLCLIIGCENIPRNIERESMSSEYNGPRTLTASMMSQMIAGRHAFQNNIDKSNLEQTTYTLQFGIVALEPLILFPEVTPRKFSPIVQAVITWKINGQHQRRVISVVSGAAISAVAEGVDVKIIDLTEYPTGYKYNVQVTLSRGVRPTVEQPPVLFDITGSQFILSTAPDNELKFPVPEDSGVISVYPFIGYPFDPVTVNPIDPRSLRMTFLDEAEIYNYGFFQPPEIGKWIPLIPGTGLVVFFYAPTLPTDGIGITLLWGIEG